MKKHKLGRSNLDVSVFCLGSMTWGSQNTAEEGHAQIDYALDHGINFIDTAEAYPTNPMSADTAGDTERVIGEWFAKTGRRKDVVLATKIAGIGNKTARDGSPITGANLKQSVEASLRKLRTDYIDVYQLHWPNRGSYHFRQNWGFDASRQPKNQREEFRSILEAVAELVAEGKIRHFGLSNESAWGTALWLEVAREHDLPRVISIQNEYSLLHRIFDLDLAELCHHEDVGLLAYSPIGAGMLTGKYDNDQTPPGSRRSINAELGGRINKYSMTVVPQYVDLARKHGLDPAQMALAFCATRPFMGSVIFGATNMDQLANNIAAAELVLSQDVLDGISAIHRASPIPL